MKTTLLAAIALALAPMAHAQASCADFDRILKEGLDDFYEIEGDSLDDDAYESTLVLAGAEACTIYRFWDASFTCTWRFDTEAVAKTFIGGQLTTMRACLKPDVWEEEEMVEEANNEWRLIGGASFSSGNDEADWAFSTRADASVSDPRHFEVEVSLGFFYY